jgi:hypothetical protein
MAERRNKRDVCLEYTFDRLLVAKLEQVYRTLVPACGLSASLPRRRPGAAS